MRIIRLRQSGNEIQSINKKIQESGEQFVLFNEAQKGGWGQVRV